MENLKVNNESKGDSPCFIGDPVKLNNSKCLVIKALKFAMLIVSRFIKVTTGLAL